MARHYPTFSALPMTAAERAYLGGKAALAMLGDTAVDAIEHLYVRDVRGTPGVHTRTVLAMYLTGRTGLVWLVTENECTCALQGHTVRVQHTEASRTLHRRFQCGDLLELEGEPSSGTAGPLSMDQLQHAWRNER